MIQLFNILSQYFQDIISNSIEPCTLCYMKSGSALRWAELKMEEIDAQPPFAQSFYTWRLFQCELTAAFSDMDRHATARLEIDNIKQGTDTIDGYNIQFTETAALTKYNDTALIEKYKQGLKELILSKIYALPTMPANLTEWKQRASLFDRQYREFQQYHHSKPASSSSSSKQKSNRSTGSSSNFMVSKPSAPTSTSTAAQTSFVPRTSTTPAPAPRPIKQEAVDAVLAEQRKQAGLCILCSEAQAGHWANECPKRVRKQFKGKGCDRGSGKAIRTMDKNSQDTSTSKSTASSTSSDIYTITKTDKLSRAEKQALMLQLIADGH